MTTREDVEQSLVEMIDVEASLAHQVHEKPEDEHADALGSEVHEVIIQDYGHIPIVRGTLSTLPKTVRKFIIEQIKIMRPRCLNICDGSFHEAIQVIHKLEERGLLEKLKHPKWNTCYVCRTDPADVARVESKTYLSTAKKYDAVPHTGEGVKGVLGQWTAPEVLQKEIDDRFPNCMAGRTMYVIPFSMGPIGSPLSKYGIELTDSNYVLLCMRIMTRVSREVFDHINDHDAIPFVKCIHSMGAPRPVQRKVINHWPCNPEKVMIAHRPEKWEILSFGSGYGGNSLLGKKCFALRIAMNIANAEGWLAEHMLIMGLTHKKTKKEYYISAAFPSACGKTNLAMILPGIDDWEVQCVGDDIAWMRFDEHGILHGINPEFGFFGVAPGTNYKTNPNAMYTCESNTIFTNVATTDDSQPFWEGLEDEVEDKNMGITTWLGERWKIGMPGKAAQPNSRFCAPAGNCPIIHPKWEDKKGVPIDCFIFGGRRPTGIPLAIKARSWQHGVMLGAALKSETTSAAEFKGKNIMHDPMAMRPFFGYNAGKYFQHWLDMADPKKKYKLPTIFHVNWFRVDKDGKFLWPGFGENIRVLEWCIRCINGEDVFEDTAIGGVPKKGSINLTGLGEINWDELMSLPKDYLLEDVQETRKYLNDQVGSDLPKAILDELDAQEARVKAM